MIPKRFDSAYPGSMNQRENGSYIEVEDNESLLLQLKENIFKLQQEKENNNFNLKEVQRLIDDVALSLDDTMTLASACKSHMELTKSSEGIVALLYAQTRLKRLIAELGCVIPQGVKLTGLQDG